MHKHTYTYETTRFRHFFEKDGRPFDDTGSIVDAVFQKSGVPLYYDSLDRWLYQYFLCRYQFITSKKVESSTVQLLLSSKDKEEDAQVFRCCWSGQETMEAGRRQEKVQAAEDDADGPANPSNKEF